MSIMTPRPNDGEDGCLVHHRSWPVEPPALTGFRLVVGVLRPGPQYVVILTVIAFMMGRLTPDELFCVLALEMVGLPFLLWAERRWRSRD